MYLVKLVLHYCFTLFYLKTNGFDLLYSFMFYKRFNLSQALPQ